MSSSLPSQLRKAQGWLVPALLVCGLLAGLFLRQRTGRGFTFVGSDSFAYIGAARELHQHHRYAFPLPDWYPQAERLKPLSPGYGRLPAYPAFLALVTRPGGIPYATIYERAKPAQWLLDLGTCLLAFLMARRLCSRGAAFLALGLAVVSPFLCWYANALLTETLTTFLTTATLWLWVEGLAAPPKRQRFLLALGGVTAGLATLTRIDSLLLLFCLLLPLLCGGQRRGLRSGALLAGLFFTVVYGAWLSRNYLRLGQPHVLAGQCDVRGHEMPHTAFYAWFASWLVDESQTPATLYCFARPECVSSVLTYPAAAFDSPQERAEVARLFALRARQGLSAETDAGFTALTLQRLRAHPLRTLVLLPLRRAYHQWISANDQPLRATAPALPWPGLTRRIQPYLRAISATLVVLMLFGLGLLLRSPFFAGRLAGLLLGLAIVLRSAALSLIGFVDTRYLLELHPTVIVLASVAVASLPGFMRRQKISSCQS